MDCNKSFNWIQAKLDGQLTAEEDAQLQAHLDNCQECRQLLSFYQCLDGSVASLGQEPPERMAQGIMYQISPEYVTKKTIKRKFHFAGTAIAAVAAVLLLLIGSGKLELPEKSADQAKSTEEDYGLYTDGVEAMAEYSTAAAPSGEPAEDVDGLELKGFPGEPQLTEDGALNSEIPYLVRYEQPEELKGIEPVWQETDITDLSSWLADNGIFAEAPADGAGIYTVFCYQVDGSLFNTLVTDDQTDIQSPADGEQGIIYVIVPQKSAD